ncbi:MAG: hypothetical protein M3015_14230 [Bacteroidota bacterium]|nr:hypothetical protein [Bacteroidota bacterium]
MKIIFICGSLEPGRDGVGDYVRCLSSELILQGHTTAAIAINDKHVEDFCEERQNFRNSSLPTLRISNIRLLKFHITYIRNWIDQFNADIISLQFVPFSFHKKGLLTGLGKHLKLLAPDRNWHVMFHELWVGMAKESSLKLKIWGTIQKRIVRQMLEEIQPKSIHTNTSLYQKQLQLLGFKSKYLPLFSNLPNEINLQVDFKNGKIKNTIYFIIFGMIHPGASIEKFAKEIAAYGQKQNLKIILRIVGRSGEQVKLFEQIWMAQRLQVEVYGEKPGNFISELLRTSSVGITTNPMSLVEKSGTVAAMLEHGLPVLSIAELWRPRIKIDKVSIAGVLQYNITNLELCLKGKVSNQYNSVSEVSKFFIDSIK